MFTLETAPPSCPHVYAVCSPLSVENLKYFKYALLCDNQERGDRVLATFIIHDFGDRL